MNKKTLTKTAWHLMRSYWVSEEKWQALGLLALTIALVLLSVFMLVQVNDWQKEFYDALQAYDAEAFLPLVGKFTLLAVIYILALVYAVYIQQKLQIKWRTWMTNRYLDSWLARQTYYRLQMLNSVDMDNPDQRISDDINSFIDKSLSLFLGFVKQLTTLVAFIFILWELSGVLELPIGETALTIPGYMVWVTILYSVVGTYLAHMVGRKLITLNYDQQRYEADFRFSMVRVRENSESIAFYGGEEPEKQNFQERFQMVIHNFWGLMKATKLYNFYASGYTQTAIIVPLLMAVPRYMAGGFQLGGLIQTLNAFAQVQGALSYFVDAYTTIAEYIAVIRRLGGFSQHMAEVDAIETHYAFDKVESNALMLKNVKVSLPNKTVLTQELSLAIPGGKYLLISGNSGCGKSTLLRALAGIWPYGSGTIGVPQEWQIMFLPQRPYLPLGSLRRAIYYPQPIPEQETVDLAPLLRRFGLEKLADKLDEVDDWSRILSLGEQQRLAFIRILLAKPDMVFLDESTSAMDEVREREAYEALREYLPQTAVVSVGHRSTLLEMHDKQLLLTGAGEWKLVDL